MKADVTHHDGSDPYANQGEYTDEDMTAAPEGGKVRLLIGHLTTDNEGEEGEPPMDFVGVTVDIDMESATELFKQLGDILLNSPDVVDLLQRMEDCEQGGKHTPTSNDTADVWCSKCGERLLIPGFAGG